MPTYDYECGACGHAFELFQSITAKPIRKCPECGKLKVKRLIGTGGGIIFRGSGFYETDYRSESYKKAAKAETEGSGTKSDGKGESKGGTGSKNGTAASSEGSGGSQSDGKSTKSGGKSDQ